MVDKLNKIENLESNSKGRKYNKRKWATKWVKIEVSQRHKVFQVIDGPRKITVKYSWDDKLEHAVPCSCTYYKNHTLETSKGAGVIEYIKDHISYNCSKVTENNLENDIFWDLGLSWKLKDEDKISIRCILKKNRVTKLISIQWIVRLMTENPSDLT